MLRKFISLMIIALCFSVCVFAQDSSWENLNRVSENSALIVEKKDGKTIKGYLVSLDNLEIKLKDRKGKTKHDIGSIRRVYAGVEKRRIPLLGRITFGVGTFLAIGIGSFAILRPDKISDEPNSLDMLGLVIATTGTAISSKFLRKLKTLKKGDLLYQE